MEFLQNYWIWIVLGIGAVWFLARRGGHGMGCGMGAPGDQALPGEKERPIRRPSAAETDDQAGHGVGDHAGGARGGRGRHGCC